MEFFRLTCSGRGTSSQRVPSVEVAVQTKAPSIELPRNAPLMRPAISAAAAAVLQVEYVMARKVVASLE